MLPDLLDVVVLHQVQLSKLYLNMLRKYRISVSGLSAGLYSGIDIDYSGA